MNITINQLNTVKTESQIKAYFDLVIDNTVTIKKCKLVQGNEGLFMSVPRQQGLDGQWQNLIFFNDKEVKAEIETAAIKKYEEAIASKADITAVQPKKSKVTIN